MAQHELKTFVPVEEEEEEEEEDHGKPIKVARLDFLGLIPPKFEH